MRRARIFSSLTYALLAPAMAVAAVPLANELVPLKLRSPDCEYEILVKKAEKDLPRIKRGFVIPHRISLWDESGKGRLTALPNLKTGETELRTHARLEYAFTPRDGRKGPCTLASLQSDLGSLEGARLLRILPAPFSLRARVSHLHGAALGVPFAEYGRFKAPKDLQDGEADVFILSRLSPGQSEALGRDARTDGETDLEFILDVKETRILLPARHHEALFTVTPAE